VQSERQLTLGDYWLIVRRRKWLLMLPLFFIPIGTALFAFSLPDIYRASTLILVESPEVSQSYVRDTVSSSVDERVRTITQQIMRPEYLEKVVKELDLVSERQESKAIDPYLVPYEFDFFSEQPENKAIDAYISKMRQNLEVKMESSRYQGQGTDMFSVAYSGENPRTVTLVVNKLASLFIEENLKVRTQQATSTREFLAMELQRVSTQLQEQEKAVSEFKQRYDGELPGQQANNQQLLSQLQQQLQDTLKALENLHDRKLLLMQRSSSPQSTTIADPRDPETNTLEQQLIQRRVELAELLRFYTDAYPEVKRLKQTIADLERRLVASRSEPQITDSSQLAMPNPDGVNTRLKAEIEEINLQERQLERQQASIRKQIAEYEQKLLTAPQRERELMVLTRDYESIQKNYQSLLAQEMNAKVAENLEKQQKAERFKLLQPARVPTIPVEPDRRKILMMGLALALAMGGGAVFLAEYLDHSFHDPEEFKQYTGLPVLATIPLIMTNAERQRRRRRNLLFYTAGVVIPAAMIAGVHFYWMNIDLLFAQTLLLLKP
jgi:polysaccharide chain length determinant protein (PEP-CTERM system associated)